MDPRGPICSENWQQRAHVADFESGLGSFDVKYCTKCRIGLTQPYPSEETSGYLDETKSSADFDVIQDGWIDRIKDHLARRLLKKISPYRDPAQVGNVLDYSCGNARFAALAHDFFPQARVDAVDYQDTPPAIFATGRFTRMRYQNVVEFGGADQKYDLIILRHVLEHTHHPIDLIRLLGSRLKPKGVLYIEVPNVNSGSARLFGSKWTGYYVPRHIFHYSSDSLQHIITTAGLAGEIEKCEMPLMGNMIAVFLKLKKSNRVVQVGGILLHPFQLLLEAFSRSSTCLSVRAKLADAAA
jgi:2-polyprenyl-3-methyl-5-hydroxy-6-metoxy-1,4-benzoquinol methylase